MLVTRKLRERSQFLRLWLLVNKLDTREHRHAALRADASALDDLRQAAARSPAASRGQPEDAQDATRRWHSGRPCAGCRRCNSRTTRSGILLAPAAEDRVEAVDAVEIGAPDREIAGARALPLLRRSSAATGRAAGCSTGARRLSPPREALADPVRPRSTAPAPSFSRQHLRGQPLGQQHAIAGDEPAGLGERSDAARRNPAARCSRRRGTRSSGPRSRGCRGCGSRRRGNRDARARPA